MISENQELLKIANARVQSLEQKVSFRAKGGSGKYIAELIKAKSERDKIAFSLTNDGTETLELIEYALEVKAKSDALTEKLKEQSERLDSFSLYLSFLENSRNKKEIPELVCETTPKPDVSEIGIRMKKERNLEGALQITQKAFDMAKLRMEKSSPAGKGLKAGQLQRARNDLNLVLGKIERFPSLIEFYQLRAEMEWKETVLKELEAHSVNLQEYMVKRQAEISLMEKWGYITTEIIT